MPERDRRGRFKKGSSGNPKGRGAGLTRTAVLRAYCEAHMGEILPPLVEAAKSGDISAARVLVDIAVNDSTRRRPHQN